MKWLIILLFLLSVNVFSITAKEAMQIQRRGEIELNAVYDLECYTAVKNAIRLKIKQRMDKGNPYTSDAVFVLENLCESTSGRATDALEKNLKKDGFRAKVHWIHDPSISAYAILIVKWD